jgi:hypothetical protein
MRIPSHILLAAVIEQRLVWARLAQAPCPHRYWFGLGLLSDHGLPLCCMHMFLAAKALECHRPSDQPLVVLLADAHALQAGHAAADVGRRARIRAQEVRAIAGVIGLDLQLRLASEMDADPLFRDDFDRVRTWLASAEAAAMPPLPIYIQRGIADVLNFNRRCGVKIGWSVSTRLQPGQGRHHEPETDLVAARIQPATAAVYVRHGVTLDVRRPRAVPYTEMDDPEHRLMLTGPSAGRYAERVAGCLLGARRRTELLDHLARTVEAHEALVGPLPGADVIAKAERLQQEIAENLQRAASSSAKPAVAHTTGTAVGSLSV